MNNTLIKNVMTTDVICVYPNDLMMKVKEIFDTNTFHHLPVVDKNEQLVGILSSHDYNKILTTFSGYSVFTNSKAELGNRKFMMSMLAKDVMTEQVAKLRPDNKISTALAVFKENLFHAIPIVNEKNRVVGILSTFDLLNFAFDEKKLLPSN